MLLCYCHARPSKGMYGSGGGGIKTIKNLSVLRVKHFEVDLLSSLH